MLKSFRFLFQFAWINLACLLGFAVLVVVGCYATGVPGGASNLFATYYGAPFPWSPCSSYSFSPFPLCTSNLNLGAVLWGPAAGLLLGRAGSAGRVHWVLLGRASPAGCSAPVGWLD